nr:stage III sporulation AC/AD family protein [bacterium]
MIGQMLGLVAAAVLCLVLRRDHAVWAAGVAVTAGLVVLIRLMPEVASVMGMASRAIQSLDGQAAPVLLRAGTVAWCSEIGSGLCEDAGEDGLAKKIVLCGRIGILVASWPLVEDLFCLVSQLCC